MRALALGLALTAGPAAAQTILSAEFLAPTARYDHGILGDALEWGDLRVVTDRGAVRLPLPESQIYEDLAPRLWDVTGDGAPEVVVVQTDIALGARLLVIGALDGSVAPLAATPWIGQTHRWLAPVGASDLDGDGQIEIALVERPHLAKVLQVWRYDGGLRLVTEASDLTTHRIGEAVIHGGITCDGRGVVTYSGDWSRVRVTRLSEGRLVTTDAGPNGTGAAEALMDCPSR